MAYCGKCGTPVDTLYCTGCGSETNVASQKRPVASPAAAFEELEGTRRRGDSQMPDTATADGFQRTPLSVLALSYATFGIYDVYYFIRGRRLAERRLGLPLTSYWYALLLLLPIANLVYYFACFNRMENAVRARGGSFLVPFWIPALFLLVLDGVWRLPDPWWMISLVSPILLASIHVSVARCERKEAPHDVWPPLCAWEIAILVVGWLLNIVVYFGAISGAKNPDQLYFVSAVGIVIGLSLVAFSAESRKLVHAEHPSRNSKIQALLSR